MSQKQLLFLLISCVLFGAGVFVIIGTRQNNKQEIMPQPAVSERVTAKSTDTKLIYKNDQFGFEFSYPRKVGQYTVEVRKTSDGAVLLDFNLPTADPDFLKSNLTQYTDLTVAIIPGVYESPNPCLGSEPNCAPGFTEEVVARDQKYTYVISLQVQSRPEDGSDKSAFEDAVQTFRLVPK
jgi:hypothetical protein